VPFYLAWWHGRNNWGSTGADAPHFSKSQAKCPFLCHLVAHLESFEDAKVDRKYTFLEFQEI